MRVIPLAAVPNQTFAVVVDNQPAQIALRWNGGALYFDLTVNGQAVALSRVCRDKQLLLVDSRYRGFDGDFLFLDQQGDADPVYTGLGDRYQLIFVSASEIAPS